MLHFAEINQDNIVVGQFECEQYNGIIPDHIKPCAGNVLGKLWNGSQFVDAPDNNVYLNITLPSNPVPINSDITVSIVLKDAAGNVVPVNGVYYVPVVQKLSNVSIKLLTVNVVNGAASTVFQLPEQGIYSVVMSAIEPKPTAILHNDVTLIVI